MKEVMLTQILWTGILMFLSVVYLGPERFLDWLLFIFVLGIIIGTMYYHAQQGDKTRGD
jgi:hypothetical protein